MIFLLIIRPLIQTLAVAIIPQIKVVGSNPKEVKYGIISEARDTSPIVIRTSVKNFNWDSDSIYFYDTSGISNVKSPRVATSRN